MKSICTKLHSFLLYGLIGLSALVTGGLFFLNFLYTSEVSYDAKEKVVIMPTANVGFLISVGCLAVVSALVLLWRKLDRIEERVLFRFFALIYTVMMVYLVLNVDHNIRADANKVLSAAKGILTEDFSSFFQGGYMYKYNLQLGLMSYDMLLMQVSQNNAILFIANFAFVLGINFLTYRIANILFGEKRVNILCITCSFAFLPQLFFIMFAYGLIPGFFFMLLAAYGTLMYFKKSQKIAWIYIVIGTSLAVMLKSNYLIGIIAITVYVCLKIIKAPKIKSILLLLILVLCAVVPNKLLVHVYEQKLDVELGKGIPSVSWLVMGLDIDNYTRGAGWYNEQIEKIYTQAEMDNVKAAEISEERLKELTAKMSTRPADARKFFMDKIKSSFCDPMFQSVWTGPLEDCKQYTHTRLLQSIYNGGMAEALLMYFNKYIQFLIWGFALRYVILFAKKTDGWQIFFLYLMGGLLFHLMWETKSQYTYTYLFSLIPFAAYSLCRFVELINGKLMILSKKTNKQYR